MNQDEQFIGYLKYTGKSVEDGLLDIRKSAEALLGFDEILRYFLLKEDPSLTKIDFEIPIRIRKGSWDALIPDIIEKILSPEGILYLYAANTIRKAANDGFFETGIVKDVKKTFQNALIAIQWSIKLATHIGSFVKSKFDNVRIFKENNETYLEILNQNNEKLKVPKKYADLYANCPENLFSKNAKIIEKDRILEFGIFEDGQEKKVTVSEKEKYIFYTQDDGEEIVLPELKHGQYVELEGEITRATENTNTIGFRYKEHTLFCKPEKGSIAKFKNKIISSEIGHLFPKVKILGQVDRADKNGEFKEKKPQIIFTEIKPLKNVENDPSLFNLKN